jgi:hypothetical protein
MLTPGMMFEVIFSSPIRKATPDLFLSLVLEFCSILEERKGPLTLISILDENRILKRFLSKMADIESASVMTEFVEYGLEYCYPIAPQILSEFARKFSTDKNAINNNNSDEKQESMEEDEEEDGNSVEPMSMDDVLAFLLKLQRRSIGISTNYQCLQLVMQYITQTFYFQVIAHQIEIISAAKKVKEEAEAEAEALRVKETGDGDDTPSKKKKKKKKAKKVEIGDNEDAEAGYEKTEIEIFMEQLALELIPRASKLSTFKKICQLLAYKKVTSEDSKTEEDEEEEKENMDDDNVDEDEEDDDDEEEEVEEVEDQNNSHFVLLLSSVISASLQFSNTGLVDILDAMRNGSILMFDHFQKWKLDDIEQYTRGRHYALGVLSDWLSSMEEMHYRPSENADGDEDGDDDDDSFHDSDIGNEYTINLLKKPKHKTAADYQKIDYASFHASTGTAN